MNYDQVGKQHVSRRKPSPLRNAKRSPVSFDAGFPQDIWPRQSRVIKAAAAADSSNGKSAGKRSSGGLSIPLAWIKNLCIIAGVAVIGVVGTNWESISENFRIQRVSLPDDGPITYDDILDYKISYAVMGDAVPSYQEMPLDLTEVFSWTEYTVKQGDTITGIAAKYSLDSGSIMSFNGIKQAWTLREGARLKIPSMDGIAYTVRKNDTISKIAKEQKVPVNAILDANNLTSTIIQPDNILWLPGAKMDASEFNKAYRRDGSRRAEKPMIYPVIGKTTSGYGWREDPVRPVPGKKSFHKAVDIAGKTGDPVKAAMSGTVLRLDNNPNLGNFIILKHDEYQTLYAHLSAYSVKEGQKVEQGQEIGKVGKTGYTTGPHLHFEVFRNGNRINPLDLIK